MANLTIPNTFTPSTEPNAIPINNNFGAVRDYINQRNSGVYWDYSNAVNSSLSSVNVSGTSTFSGGIANLMGYRRPNLVYVDSHTVGIEKNGTDGTNDYVMIFPDGHMRKMNAGVYQNCDLSADGLGSGVTGSTNIWYWIFAIDDPTNNKFYLKAYWASNSTLTSTSPYDYTVLNSLYGENNWQYLGSVKGRNSGLLPFVQSGNKTRFTVDLYDLANNSVSTSISYTYPGVGLIYAGGNPSNITLGGIRACIYASSNTIATFSDSSNNVYSQFYAVSGQWCRYTCDEIPLTANIKLTSGGVNSYLVLEMSSFVDNFLTKTGTPRNV